VTVIAAGFDGGMPKRREAAHLARREPVPAQSQADTRAGVGSLRREPAPAAPAGRPQFGAPAPAGRPSETARPQSTPPAPVRATRPASMDDDLDVPDFLK
jgi:cell division protein FtsZ